MASPSYVVSGFSRTVFSYVASGFSRTVTVRLKADTTNVTTTVRLKADTTYENTGDG